jgi:serine/threonine-protein kinase
LHIVRVSSIATFKPSNIIVGNDGRARVLDFGLARDELDGEHDVAGTPAYMAPEQRRGERVDARADQYAFCVALWEALGWQA